MRVSNPRNVRASGVRQIAFDVEVDSRIVHAVITCEAVLGKTSESIEKDADAAMAIAIELVKTSRGIAYKAAELSGAGHPGEAQHPIFLSTTNYP